MDYEMAFVCFYNASLKDYALAYYNLWVLYLEGKAIEWFCYAANCGDERSFNYLKKIFNINI